MKRLRQNKILGLAVGDRSILAAEVSAPAGPATGGPGGGGGRPRVGRVGQFTFPDGLTLQDADQLGAALGEFLRQSGFTARTAVVGVPARWVLSKAKDVPPAPPDLVADTLRLQAEGDFPTELEDFVHDYAGETSESEPRSVLLLAIPRRYLDQLAALTTAAKLHPAAVTPVTAALAAAAGRRAGGVGGAAAEAKDAMALSFGPGGAEFVAYRGAHPRVLRHLGAATAPPAALIGELRRVLAAVPAGASNGSAATNGSARRGLTVWGGAGLDPASRTAMADALGLSVDAGDLAALGVADAPPGTAGGTTGTDNPRDYAPAVALALAGLSADGPPADFLHSRMAPPVKQRVSRRTLLLVGAGVAVVGLIVYAFVDLQRRQAETTAAQKQVAAMAEDVKAAEASVARTVYAQGWQGAKPRFLSCLRDLTVVMPDDNQTFVTSLTIRENMKGALTGKTSNDRAPITLADKLNASKRFTDAKVASSDVRESARTGREVTFTITFTYRPE